MARAPRLLECAIECTMGKVLEHNDTMGYPTYLCSNETRKDQFFTCATHQMCTAEELVAAKNWTDAACGSLQQKTHHNYNGLFITLSITTCLMVIQRFSFKTITKANLQYDDWLILLISIICTSYNLLDIFGLSSNGLGTDVWALSNPELLAFGRFCYILEILYCVNTALIKLSLAVFYMRIFPCRVTRGILWATFIVVCIFGVTFTLLATFQCSPIDYNWLEWWGVGDGKCLDVNAIAWSNAGIGIALDVWMLGIPMWQLRTLNLTWKKKAGVGFMFCLGTFVTVVSVLRLHSLVYFDIPTKNPTQDLVKICIWSSLELNLGIVGLCAPSMRLLLAHTAHLMRNQTRIYGFYSVHTLTIRNLKGEVLVEEVVRKPAPERYKGGSAGFEEASSRYYAGSVQTRCSRNQGNEQP